MNNDDLIATMRILSGAKECERREPPCPHFARNQDMGLATSFCMCCFEDFFKERASTSTVTSARPHTTKCDGTAI